MEYHNKNIIILERSALARNIYYMILSRLSGLDIHFATRLEDIDVLMRERNYQMAIIDKNSIGTKESWDALLHRNHFFKEMQKIFITKPFHPTEFINMVERAI